MEEGTMRNQIAQFLLDIKLNLEHCHKSTVYFLL